MSQVVKLCAESQLDDPSAKFAAVSAISQFVKDGTVIKDVDAIDLLEWATGELTEEEDFAETLGPLRVRLVKASPKDKIAATRCLESCLLHWDLNSAQQVWCIPSPFRRGLSRSRLLRSSTGHRHRGLKEGHSCSGTSLLHIC